MTDEKKEQTSVVESLTHEDVKHIKRNQKRRRQQMEYQWALEELEEHLDSKTYNMIKQSMKK